MSNAIQIGDHIDNYEVVGILGSGTYGCVYKAEDTDTGAVVAIKILHRKSKAALRQLKHEAWVQSRLNHGNIVQCHGFKTDTLGALSKGCYLIMEFVEGKSLQEVLNENTNQAVELSKTEQIMSSCLKALDYAHTHDLGMIAHGDLKPGNILIPSDNRQEAKISDWGVAKWLGTQKTLWKGSSTCAAPEVLKSWERKEQYWPSNPQTDLFSMGIIAYYSLTSRHPFAELTTGERSIQSLIKNQDYVPPPMSRFDNTTVPTYLVEIVSKLLKHYPRERYQSASQVLSDVICHDPHLPVDIKFNLIFPDDAGNVTLDSKACTYSYAGENMTKQGALTVAQVFPSARWQCILPPEARQATKNHTIELHLVEVSGRKWHVKPFYPLVIDKTVEKV